MKTKLLTFLAAVATLTVSSAQQGGVSAGYRVGAYEVFVLTEGFGDGNTGILIGAPADITAKYAPQGTFPIATNAVLVKDKNRVWLIDTGYGQNIFKNIESLGVNPAEVNHVLLTHMHTDHVGGMLLEGEPAFPNASVVVGDRELSYWTGEDEMNKIPESKRGGFRTAREIMTRYGSRIDTVKALPIEGDYGDGIFPIEAYGHTPGHMMFLICDEGEKLLVWGDLTHAMAIQMPHPEISVTYDVDPDMARQSRVRVLEYIADKDVAVIGMHVPLPQPGKVVRDPDTGNYRFIPAIKTNP